MTQIVHLKKQKVVYFAIPKSGNTSVKTFLAPFVTSEAKEAYRNIHQEVTWPYIKHQEFLKLNTSGYLTFTVVRNPWERVFSVYRDKISRRLHGPLEKAGLSKDTTLLEFVRFIDQHKDRDLDVHLREQSWFIYRDGKLLPRHVFDISEMGKAQALFQAHVPEAQRKIEKVNVNKVVSDNIGDFLSPDPLRAEVELREFNEIVAQRFSRDVRLFDYVTPYTDVTRSKMAG
ncbi:sulfotransferase family 2 domain-containing protein [Shimia sp. R11_0]|uniref:Sulfotransferase family protein n=1 Tax=Shimia marina TaxID=321267 RepID=A0A0N7LRY8_9RHOB|nr:MULTISPECIES: sulfotransferase family 2 domain-containing protein [Shimia]MBO9479415.1 sulfotransferase family 2 domain-containing protein [Shimia sp. R11_0]CUH52140.1 Sulfotransferase family protein [Shimia marina]SFE64784.1 Sulfotransferase family protein [Shimia marina]